MAGSVRAEEGPGSCEGVCPRPSPHTGIKQGTCRTFLTNGLIYAAFVAFSSGYTFSHWLFSLQYTKALLTFFLVFFLDLLMWDLSLKQPNWICVLFWSQRSVIVDPIKLFTASSLCLLYRLGHILTDFRRTAYPFLKKHCMDSFQITFTSSLIIYLRFVFKKNKIMPFAITFIYFHFLHLYLSLRLSTYIKIYFP